MNAKPRHILETIEENDRSMDLEDTPIKERQRASTIGYESPNPKRVVENLNKYTCDTYRKLRPYFSDINKGRDQVTNDIHLDNTIVRLRSLRYTHFSDRHQIGEKYRARMMDWMIEVLNTFQQKEATFYRSVFLLDYFYYCTEKEEVLEDLHLTGIACMMIASKSEEINFIKVDSFLHTIGKKKFTKDDLLRRELEVLSAIKFTTCGPTSYELLKCSIEALDIKDHKLRAFVEKSALILTKVCLFSYQLINNLSMLEVTLYCLIIALKMAEKVRSFDSRPSVR